MRIVIPSILYSLLIWGCTHHSVQNDTKIEPQSQIINEPKTELKDFDPAERTLIKNVRLWDGTGSDAQENVVLVLRKDRIEAVLPKGSDLPRGAKVLDLRGKTIIPTLIAAHAHLGMTKDGTAGSQNLTEENVMRQLRQFENYGIGAVLSLGTDHDFIYELRDRRLHNQIQTPLILTAGHGFGTPDGAPPIAMGMDQVYRPKTIKQVRADMDQLAAHHPDVVKIWVDDFGHSMNRKMNPRLYREVIKQAHDHGLKVAVHVYYLEDAKRLASDGVDFFGHGVRDQHVDRALVKLMQDQKIGYIPTLALDETFFIYVDHPTWMDDPFFHNALDSGVWEKLQAPEYKAKEISRQDLSIGKDNVLTLFKAGIPVGLGTDSGATILRIQGFSEHLELELLVTAGLTPAQALQAGTRVNAELLGIAKDMGTLVPGKKADFIVLNDNPLLDIRNTRKIQSVWLEGMQVSTGPDLTKKVQK